MEQKTFGELLRQKRLDKDMGLREASEIIGIAPGEFSGYENDHMQPKDNLSGVLAQFLEIDQAELFKLLAETSEITKHRAQEHKTHMIHIQVAYERINAEAKKGKMRGIVECPGCGGKLHYSKSTYNGHIQGKCETEKCLSWIQ